MRKEFGSQICAQAGIYAASVALRHSSITLTREFYIDKKQPACLAISKMMQDQGDKELHGMKPAEGQVKAIA